MVGSTGLRNFVRNIEPEMMKCKDGVRLTKAEQQHIVQFYLETVHVLSINPQEKEV